MTPAEVFGAFIALLFNLLLGFIVIAAMMQLHPHGWLMFGLGLTAGAALFDATMEGLKILAAAARGTT